MHIHIVESATLQVLLRVVLAQPHEPEAERAPSAEAIQGAKAAAIPKLLGGSLSCPEISSPFLICDRVAFFSMTMREF